MLFSILGVEFTIFFISLLFRECLKNELYLSFLADLVASRKIHLTTPKKKYNSEQQKVGGIFHLFRWNRKHASKPCLEGVGGSSGLDLRGHVPTTADR